VAYGKERVKERGCWTLKFAGVWMTRTRMPPEPKSTPVFRGPAPPPRVMREEIALDQPAQRGRSSCNDSVAGVAGLAGAFARVARERHDGRCAGQGRKRGDGFLAPLRYHPLMAKADVEAE
jgi:hypothetical protein